MMIMLLFVHLIPGKVKHLYSLLDELSEKEFKRFKACLNQDLPDGFNKIPWSDLEKADVTDTVRLMKDRYGVEDRGKITKHILEEYLERLDLIKLL